jgi:hypothetical protein
MIWILAFLASSLAFWSWTGTHPEPDRTTPPVCSVESADPTPSKAVIETDELLLS